MGRRSSRPPNQTRVRPCSPNPLRRRHIRGRHPFWRIWSRFFQSMLRRARRSALPHLCSRRLPRELKLQMACLQVPGARSKGPRAARRRPSLRHPRELGPRLPAMRRRRQDLSRKPHRLCKLPLSSLKVPHRPRTEQVPWQVSRRQEPLRQRPRNPPELRRRHSLRHRQRPLPDLCSLAEISRSLPVPVRPRHPPVPRNPANRLRSPLRHPVQLGLPYPLNPLPWRLRRQPRRPERLCRGLLHRLRQAGQVLQHSLLHKAVHRQQPKLVGAPRPAPFRHLQALSPARRLQPQGRQRHRFRRRGQPVPRFQTRRRALSCRQGSRSQVLPRVRKLSHLRHRLLPIHLLLWLQARSAPELQIK